MSRLSPPLRRLVALGLLAVFIAAVWAFVALPIAARIDDYDRSIAQTRELLVRSQRKAAEAPALRVQRETLEADLKAGSGFLEGDSFELIAADLQDRIKRIVTRHGGALDSLQTLPFQLQEGYRRVAVRVTLSADTPALQKVLYDIEGARPFLLVDNLEISASALRTSRRPGDAESLLVRLDVFGFVRGELS